MFTAVNRSIAWADAGGRARFRGRATGRGDATARVQTVASAVRRTRSRSSARRARRHGRRPTRLSWCNFKGIAQTAGRGRRRLGRDGLVHIGSPLRACQHHSALRASVRGRRGDGRGHDRTVERRGRRAGRSLASRRLRPSMRAQPNRRDLRTFARTCHPPRPCNHDRRYTLALPWASIQDYAELVVDHRMLVLFHYSLRVWNRSHFGSLSLYGHSHGTLPGTAASCDVGVDVWDFRPPLSTRSSVEIGLQTER